MLTRLRVLGFLLTRMSDFERGGGYEGLGSLILVCWGIAHSLACISVMGSDGL